MSQQEHPFPSMLDQKASRLASDSLRSMMERECTTYACCDYLRDDLDDGSGEDSDDDTWSDDGGSSDEDTWSDDVDCNNRATFHHEESAREARVTSVDRATLIDWCYAIVDSCRFRRETVAVAANLADRFLATPRAAAARRDCVKLQFVILTALYISLKIHERTTCLDLEDLSVVSLGLYSPGDITGMERKMLRALDWRLCPPTGSQVARHLLVLMLPQDAKFKLEPDTWEYVRDEVAFQVETAIQDYYFATQRPSTLAAAAILNGISLSEPSFRGNATDL